MCGRGGRGLGCRWPAHRDRLTPLALTNLSIVHTTPKQPHTNTGTRIFGPRGECVRDRTSVCRTSLRSRCPIRPAPRHTHSDTDNPRLSLPNRNAGAEARGALDGGVDPVAAGAPGGDVPRRAALQVRPCKAWRLIAASDWTLTNFQSPHTRTHTHTHTHIHTHTHTHTAHGPARGGWR